MDVIGDWGGQARRDEAGVGQEYQMFWLGFNGDVSRSFVREEICLHILLEYLDMWCDSVIGSWTKEGFCPKWSDGLAAGRR